MTRNEFIDNITEWYELKDFCNDFDCDVCEDIYDDDDYVEEDIRDAIADYGWRDIRDFLGNLPSGYYYYRRNSAFDYDGLDDDDFEDYKADVLEWGDDYGAWDDEEEEDEEYADADDDFLDSLEEEPDEDETIEEEDFSIDDLIGMCSVVFVAIQNDEVEKQQEEDEAFAQLLSMDGRRIVT